jgi:hypothetical protein
MIRPRKSTRGTPRAATDHGEIRPCVAPDRREGPRRPARALATMATLLNICNLPAIVSVLLLGCGGATDDLPRRPVSGAVTLDGKPLTDARVTFQPSGGEGTEAGGEIIDGAYRIPRDEGPTPGDYVVRITSVSKASLPDPNAMPGDVPPAPKEPIPPRYNVKSTLSAKVTEEGPNAFDFDLKTR